MSDLAPPSDSRVLALPVMQCPIAGFQFHGGEACWRRIKADDRLVLRREPGNRHDARAITVEWQDVMLGYVPREANYALSQMMDRGARVEARVKSLREAADPWQRVMMEVLVHPAAGAPPPQQRKPSQEMILWPGAPHTVPRLVLVPAVAKLTPEQRDAAMRVLRECVPEIVHRLAQPVRACRDERGRQVRLWESVSIEIGADGRGLGMRYLHAPAGAQAPHLTLDLKHPIAAPHWVACFVPAIAEVCRRQGLTKATLDNTMRRWIVTSLRLTLAGVVDFEALRKAALEFLAPDPLARSLANRIFGAAPHAPAFDWVCGRAAAIALCAVEQPAMLPFLRIVEDDKDMKAAADPLAALLQGLLAEGLELAAWKRLPRWGFGAFEAMGEAWCKPIPVARFANLLLRLEVQAPPPRDFVLHALEAARYRDEPHAWLDFERHPLWFLRALLRETQRAQDAAQAQAFRAEYLACLDWLIEARPRPDANQQHAGWPWILQQARAHRKARELALAAPWAVPFGERAWGPYRVVPIRCAAELAAEAEAMKNCLANYEDACRWGEVAVFSIRERSSGARIACFAVEQLEDGRSWELVEVAGKMNATVDEEVERIAHAMVAKLNGGRGEEVPPL